MVIDENILFSAGAEVKNISLQKTFSVKDIPELLLPDY
jgi:hypothetical protein